MTTQQMELGLENPRGGRSPNPRPRRMGRANWWFDRMRQIVDRAMDWQPAPPPRPEQIWFAGAHRQVEVTAAAIRPARQQHDSEERLICE